MLLGGLLGSRNRGIVVQLIDNDESWRGKVGGMWVNGFKHQEDDWEWSRAAMEARMGLQAEENIAQ